MNHNYETGEKYLAAGDILNAFKVFATLVRDGDKRAQYQVGIMFVEGKAPIAKDIAKAVELLEKSAKQEYADSQVALGNLYYSGDETANFPAEINKGLYWLEKAAKNNHIDAQFQLGSHYLDCGDVVNAVTWLEQAAVGGNAHPQAIFDLAMIYASGMLPNADVNKTIRLLKQALEHNNPDAKLKLGMIYCTGKCGKKTVERDVDEGCRIIDDVINSCESGSIKYADLNLAICRDLSEVFWDGLYNEGGNFDSVDYRTSKDLDRCIFFSGLLLEDKEKLKLLAKKGREKEYIAMCEQFKDRAVKQKELEEDMYRDAENQLKKMLENHNQIEALDLEMLEAMIDSIKNLASIFNRKFSSDYKDGQKNVLLCAELLEEYISIKNTKQESPPEPPDVDKYNDGLERIRQRLAPLQRDLKRINKAISEYDRLREVIQIMKATALVIYCLFAVWSIWQAWQNWSVDSPGEIHIGSTLSAILLLGIGGLIIEGIHRLALRGATKPKYFIIRFIFAALTASIAVFLALFTASLVADALSYKGSPQYQYLTDNSLAAGFLIISKGIALEYIDIFRYAKLPMLLITVHTLIWMMSALIGCLISTGKLERKKAELIKSINEVEAEEKDIINKIQAEQRRFEEEAARRQRKRKEREEMEREYGDLLTRIRKGDALARRELNDFLNMLNEKKGNLEKKISLCKNRISEYDGKIERENKRAQSRKDIISYGDYMQLGNPDARNVIGYFEEVNAEFTANTSEWYAERDNQKSNLEQYESELRNIERRLRYLNNSGNN